MGPEFFTRKWVVFHTNFAEFSKELGPGTILLEPSCSGVGGVLGVSSRFVDHKATKLALRYFENAAKTKKHKQRNSLVTAPLSLAAPGEKYAVRANPSLRAINVLSESYQNPTNTLSNSHQTHIKYINILSTSHQISMIIPSTSDQHPFNLLSISHQHPINILSTSYQFPIISPSNVYQSPITIRSTSYQTPINIPSSILSASHQMSTSKTPFGRNGDL